MTPFTSILAATDFSVDGNNAVRRAALLAHDHGAQLHVMHVVKAAGCKPLRDWFSPTIDTDLKAAQARAALRRLAVEMSGAYDLVARVEVVVGDPFETLMRASSQATLVVLGQRGHGRLETLLIGRTADRLIRTCRCPVLVVKKAAAMPYRRVLMPVDFTASSDNAMRFASRLIGQAQVHVLHATDGNEESVLRRSDVDETIIRQRRARERAGFTARMARKAAKLGLDRLRTSFAVTRGPAEQATLQHAVALGSDLIVADKHGRSTLGAFLLGSVSSRVLSGSDCDVLIVPRPLDGSPPRPAASQTRAADAAARPDTAASRAAEWTRATARFSPRRTS